MIFGPLDLTCVQKSLEPASGVGYGPEEEREAAKDAGDGGLVRMNPGRQLEDVDDDEELVNTG
jgi:hypothetical protein